MALRPHIRPVASALALVAGWLAASGVARASGDVDAQTPTFYFEASGGYSVYKSKLVQSNDTSTTIGYGLGVFAGNERNVGMAITRESSAFAFELNGSSIALDVQDMHITYRWGPVHLGAVLGSSTWLVKAPPDADGDGLLDQGVDAEDLIDVITTGYGFDTGVHIPFSKRSWIYTNLTYTTASLVQQKAPADDAALATYTPHEVEMGPRMALDMGGSIGITRTWLNGTCGFKYRTYSVSVDGTAYAEQHNTTYVGLLAGWIF